ncbi:hypothetical protein ACHAPE_004267 [Trichoderma viride]
MNVSDVADAAASHVIWRMNGAGAPIQLSRRGHAKRSQTPAAFRSAPVPYSVTATSYGDQCCVVACKVPAVAAEMPAEACLLSFSGAWSRTGPVPGDLGRTPKVEMRQMVLDVLLGWHSVRRAPS